MNKYIWIFGGISGLLASVSEYLVYSGVLSFDDFGGVRLFKLLTLVICIVFAGILYKKMQGGVSLARVMFISVLVSLVRSAVLCGGFLLMYWPDGERFEPARKYAYEKSLEMMKEEDKTISGKQKKKAEIEAQFSLVGYPKFALAGGFFVAVFTGVFLGLIIAKRNIIPS